MSYYMQTDLTNLIAIKKKVKKSKTLSFPFIIISNIARSSRYRFIDTVRCCQKLMFFRGNFVSRISFFFCDLLKFSPTGIHFLTGKNFKWVWTGRRYWPTSVVPCLAAAVDIVRTLSITSHRDNFSIYNKYVEEITLKLYHSIS